MNYQLWVAFKLRVNQSNLEADISFIRVGKNDESWSKKLQRKYNLMKISWVDENITSWQ